MVMLAKKYEGQDVTGWLYSEKLDGVRAIWTGTEFISRQGKPINAPQWFKDTLPPITLDGELWLGRKQFQKCVGIVRKKNPIDSEWIFIKYAVFDLPNSPNTFESRYSALCELLHNNDVAYAIEHKTIYSKEHLDEEYKKVMLLDGEGLMIRNPYSYYEERRSPNLLKYKPCITDEAVVVGYTPGEGKHTGRMGSLMCSWNGHIIEIGTGFTDAERVCPPEFGDVITFEYQELTDRGVPRFPVYVCVRDYE